MAPGRLDLPSATDERSTLDPASIPPTHLALASQHQLEESRWRVVYEIRRFALWAQLTSSPRLTPTTNVATTIAFYLHHLTRTLASHPEPRRRVTRPSTTATWFRRLAAGIPAVADVRRAPLITRTLKGLQALAPAQSPYVLRNVSDRWQRATDAALQATTRSNTSSVTLAAALWLALELQRQGLRPLAAVRATLPQARRLQRSVNLPLAARPRPTRRPTRSAPALAAQAQARVWEVSVLLDKDNSVGALAAPRRRWIASTPAVDRAMKALPLPYDRQSELIEARRSLLRQHDITQTYAARRDAAAAAEERSLPLTQLLNHRPGSRSTPVYAGTSTATALLQALTTA